MPVRPLARGLVLLGLAIVLATGGGCASYSDRIATFRLQYGAADFAAAEASIDELIVDETGVDEELLDAPKSLARAEDAADDDGYLLLLEKAMVRLCRYDPDGAIELLRRARDELDRHWRTSSLDYVQATLLDDSFLEYAGADYEHILVRVMLALADLVTGGGDATAYAIQISTRQEEILQSDFGAKQGYAPRQNYRRVAIGAYLEGVRYESTFAPAEAARAYERAIRYGGATPLFQAALERARHGAFCRPGCGVVHVFYLVGRGPFLVEGVHAPTELASRLAGVAITLVSGHPSALVQAPVKVPVLAMTDLRPPPLSMYLPGLGPVVTQTVLDVNQVASEQLEANLPWIIARAMIRRALKATAAAAMEHQGRRHHDDGLAFLFAALFNLTVTAVENADTRNWLSLPAEIQAARLDLPAGTNVIPLGQNESVHVRVAAGHDSYVLVIRPNPNAPAAVLVDVKSRPYLE